MKKTINSKILIMAVLLGCSLAFTLNQSGLKVGDKAPSFKLKGTDNQEHSFEDFKDAKGYVVIFTCNHCPYSKAYEDRIIALDKKYKDLGYPVIAINPNNPKTYPSDNFENMKKRAKEKGFTFPYLVDKGQKLYPKYGATKTPHVYLLNKEKEVKYIGAIDDNTNAKKVKINYLDNAIQALIKGENPSPNYTKAIGCSIKK